MSPPFGDQYSAYRPLTRGITYRPLTRGITYRPLTRGITYRPPVKGNYVFNLTKYLQNYDT